MEDISKEIIDYKHPFQWTCPYCNRDTTIITHNCRTTYIIFPNNDSDEKPQKLVRTTLVVCPNKECQEISVYSGLFESRVAHGSMGTSVMDISSISGKRIQPENIGMKIPDYIPEAIRNDYYESIQISELSPKASATLSRRCLQGMIRDFWLVKPGRLIDEIDQIKDKQDRLTYEAIDSLRKIGNIGAHMEKDINMIIDVEKNEAQLLISLNEMLLTSWYIDRYNKNMRMEKIKEIAEKK